MLVDSCSAAQTSKQKLLRREDCAVRVEEEPCCCSHERRQASEPTKRVDDAQQRTVAGNSWCTERMILQKSSQSAWGDATLSWSLAPEAPPPRGGVPASAEPARIERLSPSKGTADLALFCRKREGARNRAIPPSILRLRKIPSL